MVAVSVDLPAGVDPRFSAARRPSDDQHHPQGHESAETGRLRLSEPSAHTSTFEGLTHPGLRPDGLLARSVPRGLPQK